MEGSPTHLKLPVAWFECTFTIATHNTQEAAHLVLGREGHIFGRSPTPLNIGEPMLNASESSLSVPASPSFWNEMRSSEDWWAVWIGSLLLGVIVLTVQWTDSSKPVSLLKPYVAKPAQWTSSLSDALISKSGKPLTRGIITTGVLSLVAFSLAQVGMGRNLPRFLATFPVVFALAFIAQLLSEQSVIKYYNLEYPLWGLIIGFLVNVCLGAKWLQPALQTEFYVKTGLVLLGVEVLIPLLLTLGIPGICVSWVTTPIVLIVTFLFGQRVLKIKSPSLNMVISADMAVCGVSAAIATGAACRAKKEEVSLAITLSLVFTAIMMVIQPAVIVAVGMNPVVAGAWLGGTIDSTGAVAAAGEIVGPVALMTATTVKLIQNVLIGAIAFGVATYWVTRVEQREDGVRPNPWEIWYRFPKFVFGFVAISAIFSLLSLSPSLGQGVVDATTSVSKELRTWFFCLAFICIGLDVDFAEIRRNLQGGKPLVLYVCGQSLNLMLSLLMSWLMYGVLFQDATNKLIEKAESQARAKAELVAPAAPATKTPISPVKP